MPDLDQSQYLFPYKTIRPFQKEMLECVVSCIENKKHAIIHAPTGLGKTVSTLAPALAYALKNKKVVFFLTSRHTQHHIVIDTLKEIKTKYASLFSVSDIIGKKWMCLQPGVNALFSSDFLEYCKAVREQNKCFYYESVRENHKLTPRAAAFVDELTFAPLHLEETMDRCSKEELCPYEIALVQSAKAAVIVADYNYIFNPIIRKQFLAKIHRELKDCIIIVDEAHNLPKRMREIQSHKLSTIMIHKAMKEAKKYNFSDAFTVLGKLYGILITLGDGNEQLMQKQIFVEKVKEFTDYSEIIDTFYSYAEEVRADQKTSYLGSIASFLEDWPEGDEGFVRIFTKWKGRMNDYVFTLSKKGLDPSFVTRQPIAESHSTIMMSGTMTPTSMYKELLGFPDNTVEQEFKSSFPPKNRLVLLVPETSTKYATRSPAMYKRIATMCATMINKIPGNAAIFFPSYAIRDEVADTFTRLCTKTLFMERPAMQKNEKKEMLDNFKTYQNAVLLAVSSGNFSEGIDLPGVLKCVIVVGIPLQPPDLEMRQLVDYYERLFKKGWDYGYIFPAFSKCIQSAGRAIRSEKDRGVLIFLDERFAWPKHLRYFPADWNLTITTDYNKHIHDFFADSFK